MYSCDKSKYSVDFGGGAPQTDGFQCPAIEYRVTKNGTNNKTAVIFSEPKNEMLYFCLKHNNINT